MLHEPLVSVIIPTYNRLLYLEEAIKSAVQQTYKNIEIIVSDDCSSESPQALIDSFQDTRICLRRNPQNLGISLNFFNAVQTAKGKYFAILNDDDLWDKNFLETLIPPLEANSNLSLAFCDHFVVNPQGVINHKATEENTRYWKRDLLKEGVYQPFYKIALVDQSVFLASAAVIRKDAINWQNFAPEAGVFWDLYVTYLACCSGDGAYYYPGRLVKYRESEQSIIRSTDVQAKLRKAKAGMYCYYRFMNDDNLKEFQTYFQQKWVDEITSFGISLLRAKQLAEARLYLWFAICQQKFNWRTVVALLLSFTHPAIASQF